MSATTTTETAKSGTRAVRPSHADATAPVPWLVVGMGSMAYGKERRAVTALKHMPRIKPYFLTSQWEDGTVSELLRTNGFAFTSASVGYLGRAQWRWTLLNIRLMPKLFWTVWWKYREQRCRGVLVLALQPFANVFPPLLLLKFFCGSRLVFYLGDIPANTFPNRVVCRLMTWVADGIVVNSEAVRRSLAVVGVPSERVLVIHNGLALERFREAAPLPWHTQFGWNRDTLMVGYVGQFSEIKGVWDFVHAAERVLGRDNRCRFVLVGKTDDTNACFQDIALYLREQRLEKEIVFAGWITRMEDVYATLDLVIVPSRHEEAAANVNIEAMASGVPVIATRTGGTPELIADGVTGILIEPAAPVRIAESILRLAHDPQLRSRMGAAGRERAGAMFDATRNAVLIEQILTDD